MTLTGLVLCTIVGNTAIASEEADLAQTADQLADANGLILTYTEQNRVKLMMIALDAQIDNTTTLAEKTAKQAEKHQLSHDEQRELKLMIMAISPQSADYGANGDGRTPP